MSNYSIFLDDERVPSIKDDRKYMIARSMDDVEYYLTMYGCPNFIAFDHDLGLDVPTGYDVAKMLVKEDIARKGHFFPKDFKFFSHSQNPIGKENIEKLLNNYLKLKRGY